MVNMHFVFPMSIKNNLIKIPISKICWHGEDM